MTATPARRPGVSSRPSSPQGQGGEHQHPDPEVPQPTAAPSLEPTVLAYFRDKTALRALVEGLPAHRLRVVGASTLEGFEEALRTQTPEVILAEHLASNGGSRVSRELSTLLEQSQAPVILLVEPDQLSRRSAIGQAADFVLKPFNFTEVVARIERVLRQHPPKERSMDRVVVGDLELDLKGFKLWINGAGLHLTYKEMELLRFLVQNRGKVVTRSAILNNVWGYQFSGSLRTVDVHVRRLRAKLALSTVCAVETVVNVGYKFVVGGS
ncbi:MAG: response regulator transcription factor [Chloroflexi bacterium]|nr:response regulator transcription factor [Chloroflexota bacterium]